MKDNNLDNVVSLIDELMSKGNNHVNIKYDENNDTIINSNKNCETIGCCMQPNEPMEKGE